MFVEIQPKRSLVMWLIRLLLIICPSSYKARPDNLLDTNSSCSGIVFSQPSDPRPNFPAKIENCGRGWVRLAPRLKDKSNLIWNLKIKWSHSVRCAVVAVHSGQALYVWLFRGGVVQSTMDQTHTAVPRDPSPRRPFSETTNTHTHAARFTVLM